MYNSVMDTGFSPLSKTEELMRNVQVSVITSKQMALNETWRLDLYSPFWRLYVQNQYGAYIEYDGKRMDLKPRTICLIPAWVHFQTGIKKIVLQNYIHFHLLGLPNTLLKKFFSKPTFLKMDEPLESLCSRWKRGLDEPDDFSHRFWASALAQAALAFILDQLSSEEQKQCFRWMVESGDLREVIHCIESQFSQPPTNAALAKLCGMSEDHFIRKFRLAIGMTPAQFGLERRIATSAEWLVTTTLSLDEIAEKFGFTDRFHFSRCFSSRIGFPPATYRRLHRKHG